MTFECPTLLTSDQAFREDNYTGLYFTPHGAMLGEHVYVIATGFGVDDRIVRYTLTDTGLENPTEIRASTDGGSSRWMTWLTIGADGRCYAHIEDSNWPAPLVSRIVEIDLSDGSDRTITSESASWYYECLIAHPTGGLFALRRQVASGGAEDFELVGIDPDTSTVTVLDSTSAHQGDQTGTRLLPIGTTGSWPGMVGTADDALWVTTATGSGSGWTYGYRKYSKAGSVLVDNPAPSERTWWWMPDPAAPDTLLASIGPSGPSVGLHRIHSDGTTSPLDCEWAPYPPTIVAPTWSKAISANWWEAWEEIWVLEGTAPPPATGGWRVGRIGFPTAAPSISFVATLLHTLDLAPEDITQDFDGNRQDLWHGEWSGTGTVEGVTPSTTTGVIAHLAPGTYSITLNWVGVLLTGEPIHGVEPLPTPFVGMWVGPVAGFQGVSVPFGGGGQAPIVSPTESAIVTVTNPAYTELHLTTLNKQDDSTIFMPAGITVTITRL